MNGNRSEQGRIRLLGIALALTLSLGGCASQDRRALTGPATNSPATRPPAQNVTEATSEPASSAAVRPADAQIYRGTGTFINAYAARGDVPATGPESDGATLNFEGAEIREVVQLILGDTLQENYVIDAGVRGTVTLRTSERLNRDALLSVLETVLQVNGAAMLYADGLYRIVPLAGALQGGGALGVGTRPGSPGYQSRVIALRFIAAQEMKRILEPLFRGITVVEADRDRNLLMLSGTAGELKQAGQLIEMFDVDMLSGMSVGVFPLYNVDTATMETELSRLLNSDEREGIGGMVRLVPVERLNALMVVTPQARYLDTLKTWIDRLDVPTEGGGRRLYVYRVQNVRAASLAGMLRDLFAIGDTEAAASVPTLAPGASPRIIQSRPGETFEETAAAVRAVGVIQRGSAAEGLPARDDSIDAGTVGNVSIIADESSNALAILASPGDYSRIESAMTQLDVLPRQVLLETTIVEVALTGDLSYGMQWFFDHRAGDDHEAIGTVGLPLAFPGTLSYSIVNSADEVRAVLRILATEDKLRVVSSPSVLVMDNQTANIRVGNQQPVSTAIITEGGIVSTSVQFKNTGITLDVTPRVNASGLVTLEINQEVTDVGQIDDATGQRAFLQRSIGSNVAVNSGESIVLGGLIRENDTESRSGVPGLYRLPVIGSLFGQRVRTTDRTELLVLLTATVINNASEAQDLIEEFRLKMPSLFPLPAGVGPESLREGSAGVDRQATDGPA